MIWFLWKCQKARPDPVFVALLLLLLLPLVGFAKEDYSIILKRNIFTAPPPPPKVEPRSILKPVEPPPPPPLESRIEIRGIFHLPDGKSSVFIKKKSQSDEAIFKVGETVEGAKIMEIEPTRVIFEYDGKTLAMNLDNKTSAAQLVSVDDGVSAAVAESTPESAATDSTPVLPRTPDVAKPVALNLTNAMDELRNDKDLARNLNVTPSIVEGRVDGFRIANLPENSVPYQYGLRNGDVIHRVNGVLIDSLARGVAVYNNITKTGVKLVTVEVLRSGQPLILSYQIQ